MGTAAMTSQAGPTTAHATAVHVRECYLELMSGCQLVAEVSRSHGRTGPGPDIAHTSVADGPASRSRLASRLGAYQARGHRTRLSAMVYR